ncbi:MAG: type IV toxin-antitoxin system AbiEi family antitoxin domain-containing protein [Actinobacteria bacterium]|nr:type IV toxin-antitoxin system AbiEi family antitoxin domain-containing protein [Actinomycetota bacterium]
MIREEETKAERILQLAGERGVLRPRDLKEIGISPRYLSVLRDQGLLEQPARGLYMLTNADVSEHVSFAQAAKLVPHGVICLVSALVFHELTTQLPFQVWMAIDQSARLPKKSSVPIRIVRFSGPALASGIEQHDVDGVAVRIYGPAKTVADCFKYRNKIGLDVAIEALRDCWNRRLCSMDDLWNYARVCRVGAVMRPYLESLV